MIHIRWMIRVDMPAILDIENESFPSPWSEDEFIRCLLERNCIGMVAEQDDQILGYMIYELEKTRLRILDFAVRKGCRKQGIGRALFNRLAQKLRPTGRTKIITEVRETNMDALLFFKAVGCRAIEVLRDFYDETDEDAIVMQYRVKQEAEKCT